MSSTSFERFEYRGKHYQVPLFDTKEAVTVVPRPSASEPSPARSKRSAASTGVEASGPDVTESGPAALDIDSRIIRDIDSVWDVSKFQQPARPVSLGTLSDRELETFAAWGAPRVLDMPIKFPGSDEYRLPAPLAQFAPVIQRIANVEHRINPAHDDYYAYLTIDQRVVQASTLQREAPCHVDGFQGARWKPKARINHSYTVSDILPTAYYVQPFDLTALDEAVHDFFWEMNAQVADTNEAHRWQPAEREITLMDCYCVHRGVEATETGPRTWLRLSFEERRRVFDRLGNAHNPLFDYDWEMVERDIEQLGLVPFRKDCDPSLRVFPWQGIDGEALPAGAPKTKPRLRRD